MGENASGGESLIYAHPTCTTWGGEAEGSIYHLASIRGGVGFMGGSGFFGLGGVFSLLGLGFLCSSGGAWLDVCAADIFSWGGILFAICFVQFIYGGDQVRSVSFDREFQGGYSALFQPLGISLRGGRKIVLCCDAEVVGGEKEHCYAMQGKTPGGKLSLLVSGRFFLHYILGGQFLDSPEWDSLRRGGEGIFQVTLTAETDCRYVAWGGKKLYLLFAKHRFRGGLFSILIGSDIAEGGDALNDRVNVGKGLGGDIRLPNFYHVSLRGGPLVQPSHHLQRGGGGRKPTGVANCGSLGGQ
ncbi:POPD3 protein, partial [Chordeiles acutipennis]|nr:POPD3 protein [Chordeiles acutipennis]